MKHDAETVEALERWEASHGKASEELAECPVISLGLQWVWKAFVELSGARGFGPSAIRHSDILAYCVLRGVSDVERLCLCVMRMDRVWLQWASKEK